MSSKSQTTWTYYCDLCGEERAKDTLVTVYDSPMPWGTYSQQQQHADVCDQCRSKPIANLLGYLADKAKNFDPWSEHAVETIKVKLEKPGGES